MIFKISICIDIECTYIWEYAPKTWIWTGKIASELRAYLKEFSRSSVFKVGEKKFSKTATPIHLKISKDILIDIW